MILNSFYNGLQHDFPAKHCCVIQLYKLFEDLTKATDKNTAMYIICLDIKT